MPFTVLGTRSEIENCGIQSDPLQDHNYCKPPEQDKSGDGHHEAKSSDNKSQPVAIDQIAGVARQVELVDNDSVQENELLSPPLENGAAVNYGNAYCDSRCPVHNLPAFIQVSLSLLSLINSIVIPCER